MPRLSLSATPKVDSSADVHEFSYIEGDVTLAAGVVVAPGTAITAESGASVVVSEGVSLLSGVLVEGVSGPKVSGQSSAPCSVFLGDRVTLAHKSIVHSPAFIGKGCFVGFRSTIYNARLGAGCVVMMHALIQDVEVPPGKCVPSGSVITSQHQADQLPNVRPEDLEFSKEIAGSVNISRSSGLSNRSSGLSNRSKSRLVPIRGASPTIQPNPRRQSPAPSSYSSHLPAQPSTRNSSYDTEGANMQTQRLSPELVQQVRQHLAQGFRIGMEHADKRRYRSGVWETCTPIKDTREQAVFEALERCLAEHQGEYVRMFGIDPQVKQRVGMVTVQRPDGQAVKIDGKPAAYSATSGASANGSYSSGAASSGGGGLTANVVEQVRSLLRSGFIIGTEHADPRRFRSNVWKSCSPIQTTNERDVLAHLEHCLAEHSGEYVRMFGIDPQAKRRVSTETIQRADGQPVDASGSGSVSVSASRNQSYGASQGATQSGYSAQGGGNSGVTQAVNQILSQGSQIGVETADARRYRSGIWQTAPTVQSANQLQNFLSQNPDKYVRIFGVNKAAKTRGSSTTVQKPGQSQDTQSSQGQSSQGQSSQGQSSRHSSSQDPINENPPHYDDPKYLNRNNSQGYGGSSNHISGGDQGKIAQVFRQGSQVGIEIADARRYRSGIWQTAPTVQSASQLQNFLSQNADKYVRIFSVDKATKTRGASVTVQKPGQPTGAQFSQGGQDPINANPPHYDDPKYLNRNNSQGYGGSSNHISNGSNGNGAVDSDVMNKVTQLVNQGCKIAIEFADKRRFRSGIWQTGPAIESRRPAEAISALGKQLAQHSGDYVRLVGVDPQAKRRVLETTIQRP